MELRKLTISGVLVNTVVLTILVSTSSTVRSQPNHFDDAFHAATISSVDGGATTENEIPVFPSTTVTSGVRHKSPFYQHKEDLKKTRLLKFLRHFRLDFSKFDTTCIKREGRGLSAPPVSNARVIKYTRRRNRARPRNYYAMVLFECNEGYEFPMESSDRMFCSRNKWVGPTPVCLDKGSLDESDCSSCEQICSHQGSEVVCSCYSGYEMAANGSCVDLDECQIDNGGCHGICFNQPGSFQCFCPSGYQVGPDGKNCIDKNECLLRNGHGPCQDVCSNTPGGYDCSCERIPGTRLAVDKHSCEDINECQEQNNFGCSHMCLNTFGNAFCACPKGFILSSDDYKTCLDENPEPKPTLPPTLPVTPEPPPPPPENLEMLQPVADCPPGSALDSENSLICVEHDDCSVENGGCEHICISSGTYRLCSCRTGYELVNETACIDKDECQTENGGCDQECVNIPGGFFCSCKPGYSLKDDQRTCEAKYCGELPTTPSISGWECEHSDFLGVTDGTNSPPGTKCRAKCHEGFSLKSRNEITHNIFGKQVKSSGFGTGFMRCNEEGLWSPRDYLEHVECLKSSCSTLRKPEFGSLFPELCLSNSVPLNTQCLILCSTGYYPKHGRIRTCSKGYQWFPEDTPLCVKLPATPRPYIHCPSDVNVDLMPGMSSAYVKIPQPQANMDWYRYVEAEPPWAKNLEWEVPAGITEVTFIARSPVSNDTATCRFKIHVIDREAPHVQGCPTSFEIRLSPGETAREVWWSEPKFTDNVKLHYVQQSHTPGKILPRGNHHISFIAGDAEGNKARCSFTITIQGPEDYEMSDYSFYTGTNSYNRQMIICPNLKTGRWTIHYAYYLPPGCRYSSSSDSLTPKLLKQSPSYKTLKSRLRRRLLTHK